MAPAQRAGLRFGDEPLERITSSRYLGITFSASCCLAGTTAKAHWLQALRSLCNLWDRCAALGIQAAAAPLRQRLLNTPVDSVLSYSAKI